MNSKEYFTEYQKEFYKVHSLVCCATRDSCRHKDLTDEDLMRIRNFLEKSNQEIYKNIDIKMSDTTLEAEILHSPVESSSFICSNCGKILESYFQDYCSNCGARFLKAREQTLKFDDEV